MFHRSCSSPARLSARDVRHPAGGSSTKKAVCIDDDSHEALLEMLNMFVSSHPLWENRDLPLPAFIWAPTTAVLVDQGLIWELRAVQLQDRLELA
jgi:hypothetical protein